MTKMLSEPELVKLIECPVCLDVPVPPITNCLNGHLICSTCRPKLSNCGICSKKLTDSRNLLAEAIVDASKFKCLYQSQGCSEIVLGSKLKVHSSDCDYRPIHCVNPRNSGCNGSLVDYSEFIRHLKTVHNGDGYDTELEHFDKVEKSGLENIRSWPLFYMTYDNKKFLKHTSVEKRVIYWWISLLGTEKEAEKYLAIITVFPYDKNDSKKIDFTIPIHSVRKSLEELKRSSACASLPKDYIVPFCLQNYKTKAGNYKFAWRMRFKIVKK